MKPKMTYLNEAQNGFPPSSVSVSSVFSGTPKILLSGVFLRPIALSAVPPRGRRPLTGCLLLLQGLQGHLRLCLGPPQGAGGPFWGRHGHLRHRQGAGGPPSGALRATCGFVWAISRYPQGPSQQPRGWKYKLSVSQAAFEIKKKRCFLLYFQHCACQRQYWNVPGRLCRDPGHPLGQKGGPGESARGPSAQEGGVPFHYL